ncbi:hypothetical protein [Pseudomonas aeruginosa]|uniref:hypothetical protein n=1 Tax=Pseudomonas aeruginosa TaxID=287 RepID=UPI001067BB93|nr:hypothetical protein [Pseudomonas aeruginosa]TEG90695.1 hypothetical protein IPC1330_12600 [Pseudomonas aeruginosa]
MSSYQVTSSEKATWTMMMLLGFTAIQQATPPTLEPLQGIEMASNGVIHNNYTNYTYDFSSSVSASLHTDEHLSLEAATSAFSSRLASMQEPLEHEFSKILSDNFLDLLA